MVCFSIGFRDSRAPTGGTYSMQIADTIQITTEANPPYKRVPLVEAVAMDLADSDSDEASDEASDADRQISRYEARRRKRAQFENSSNTAQARNASASRTNSGRRNLKKWRGDTRRLCQGQL